MLICILLINNLWIKNGINATVMAEHYCLKIKHALACDWPVHAWFLVIPFVQEVVCVCVCVPPGYKKQFT